MFLQVDDGGWCVWFCFLGWCVDVVEVLLYSFIDCGFIFFMVMVYSEYEWFLQWGFVVDEDFYGVRFFLVVNFQGQGYIYGDFFEVEYG